MTRPTATIEISGLRLSARVGVSDEELERDRPIVVDVELLLVSPAAADTDSIDDTIDYASVAALATAVSAEQPHRTLERLATRISERVRERFEEVETVTVRVRKPAPPMEAEVDYVAVTLSG